MDASWLPLLVSAAVVTAAVLLVALCVDCRNKGPLVSITQTHVSDDYIRPTDFMNPTQRTDVMPSSGLLSPPSHSSDRPRRSFTPTETESNPSYENPGPESLDSDADETGYILVLPEGEAAPPPLSRASTLSSDVQHNYVNVGESPADDNPDYVNVQPEGCFGQFSALLAQTEDSEDSEDSEDDEDSDDEQGNYVNQPTMIGGEPGV